MSKRTVTTYLVLEARRGWGARARVVAHCANAPTLKRGQCSVKITISVPAEAFEPAFFAPQPIDFELGGVLRADAATVTPEPQT